MTKVEAMNVINHVYFRSKWKMRFAVTKSVAHMRQAIKQTSHHSHTAGCRHTFYLAIRINTAI